MSALLPVIGPMMIGWVPVGLVMAVLVYYPSLWSIETYQKKRGERLKRKRSAASQNNVNKS
jgi:uncharacterized protein (DUF2062 family)